MKLVTITAFRSCEKTVTAKNPILVEAADGGHGYTVFKLASIGLDCYVENDRIHRAPLAIACEMAFLWRNYAKESDDKLDPEALQVKRNLNELFTEA